MAENESGDKTEKPTGKHLDEAFERGHFAHVPELQVLATITAVLTVLGFVAQASCDRVEEYATGIFVSFTSATLKQETVTGIFGDFLMAVAPIVLPMLLACSIAATIAGGIQTGFKLTPKALGLKWERLSFSQGWGKMFSKATYVHCGFDILKMIAIGFSLYVGARHLMLDPLFSTPIEAPYLGQFMNQAAQTFFGRLLVALGIIAALSFSYEKFKTAKELMMSRQEVKDESKGQEMDGQVKGARIRMGRRLMQKQMLADVATADVVVTNPTHYAVALKYERGKDHAPVVLAKGENRFAMRIKEIAAENGVPMVENKPVARLLFAMGKVGEAIPPDLYAAVASILAVVYRTHRYYFHRLRSRRLEVAA